MSFTSSGSRYRTGFERAQDRTNRVDFSYHFVGNRYVNARADRSDASRSLAGTPACTTGPPRVEKEAKKILEEREMSKAADLCPAFGG